MLDTSITQLLPRSVLPIALASAGLLATATVYFLYVLLVQRRRLSHIPGPFWASITGFWLASRFRRGISFVTIARGLDEKYGPVVQYAPRRVLFSDPAAIPIVYGTTKPFPKARPRRHPSLD